MNLTWGHSYILQSPALTHLWESFASEGKGKGLSLVEHLLCARHIPVLSYLALKISWQDPPVLLITNPRMESLRHLLGVPARMW